MDAAQVIVVPTMAMADRLRAFVDIDTYRIAHIPWGIPDRLLIRPPRRIPRSGGELRVLYAGRLTEEKGISRLAGLLADVDGIRLSMAAPRREYAELAKSQDLSAVDHLGWLRRPQLWRAFAEQDVLVVPSATLEAFGLVAVEAQACGLPVAYRPVPGLTEALGASGLALDLLTDPPGAVSSPAALRDDDGALAELRRPGYRNAARFPLSATAHALESLGADIA
ncbi:glycosyltransferase [Streptomyces sp. NPDC048644]|uniref:glycosyltransferase n=1 Tax=Streptomyces sp. NPDC048644 TaxID=3365582 RepID=UPI00371F3547